MFFGGGGILSDITYLLVKKSIDAAALRQKVIANNVANVNTKNFKRSDVVFEDMLLKEIKRENIDFHKLESLEPEVVTDNSTSMRMDGNNVDIDLEMTNMAANNILYNTLVTQLNTRFSILKNVISEGRK